MWGYKALDVLYSLALIPAGYIVFALMRLAVDLMFSPSLIHKDSQQEIGRLQQEVSRLHAIAFPPISPEEARKRAYVADILTECEFTPREVPALERSLVMGSINVASLDRDFFFARRPLMAAQRLGLVVRAGNDSLSINPALESALKHFLSRTDATGMKDSRCP